MFRRNVGDGIVIKQFEVREADMIFEVVERNREYLRQWLPWVDLSPSAEQIRHFIVGATAQFEAGLGPNSGIWLDGVLVGSMGCHAFELANRSGSLGYWIEAGRQGKGIVTRCCSNLLDYLFDEVGLHRVEIRCGTGNRWSSAVPRRLGFSQEGLLRDGQWVNDHWVDLEVWSMLAPNWTKAPQP